MTWTFILEKEITVAKLFQTHMFVGVYGLCAIFHTEREIITFENVSSRFL